MEHPATASALAPLPRACLWGTPAYLGIQDACLHPGHPLVLPEQLDLADLAELRQHCGEVGLQVDDMADAMPGSHQKCGRWLLLILVARACVERDRQTGVNKCTLGLHGLCLALSVEPSLDVSHSAGCWVAFAEQQVKLVP